MKELFFMKYLFYCFSGFLIFLLPKQGLLQAQPVKNIHSNPAKTGMMKMETRFGAEFVDPKGHDQPTDLDGVDGDARSCEYY